MNENLAPRSALSPFAVAEEMEIVKLLFTKLSRFLLHFPSC